ncbi:MAG TPA: hypothetical protein DDW83_06130 [Peptococcaceae bacterium]|nr:hypothetical protein [Peptococcaceae bacterium]
MYLNGLDLGGDCLSEQEKYYDFDVLTFPSTHYALKAEKLCKKDGIRVAMIPLPRELSTDCGVSLIVCPEECKNAENLLRQAGVSLNGVHRLQRKGKDARLWQNMLNI